MCMTSGQSLNLTPREFHLLTGRVRTKGICRCSGILDGAVVPFDQKEMLRGRPHSRQVHDPDRRVPFSKISSISFRSAIHAPWTQSCAEGLADQNNVASTGRTDPGSGNTGVPRLARGRAFRQRSSRYHGHAMPVSKPRQAAKSVIAQGGCAFANSQASFRGESGV